MSNGASVVKLLNFFVKFREKCKNRNSKDRLIDIIREVFDCDNDDEVFALYPMLLNQVKYASAYLEQNTNHNMDDLSNVSSHLKNAINLSREKLYHTISQYNQDPKGYPLYLDQNIFTLFRSFALGLGIDDEIISQADIDDLIKSIEDLAKDIEAKNMKFGDKLYLQNLLKKIALTLKNYDKLSLSDDLSGDSISLWYNASINDEIKQDDSIFKKIGTILNKVLHTVKPDKLELGIKAKVLSILEIKATAQWENNSISDIKLY